jgi:hypothetical protein
LAPHSRPLTGIGTCDRLQLARAILRDVPAEATWSQFANRQVGRITRGGRLTLTNEALVWTPTLGARRQPSWRCPLSMVRTAEATGRTLNILVAGPRRRLRIVLVDGGEEVFVVNRVDRVMTIINDAIRRPSDPPAPQKT